MTQVPKKQLETSQNDEFQLRQHDRSVWHSGRPANKHNATCLMFSVFRFLSLLKVLSSSDAKLESFAAWLAGQILLLCSERKTTISNWGLVLSVPAPLQADMNGICNVPVYFLKGHLLW